MSTLYKALLLIIFSLLIPLTGFSEDIQPPSKEIQPPSEEIQPPSEEAQPLEDWLTPLLQKGDLATAKKALTKRIKTTEEIDNVRFALAIVELLQGIEKLGQTWYRYGLNSSELNRILPFFRLPLLENPRPDTLTYPIVRKTLATLLADFGRTQMKLAEINVDKVKLALKIGLVQLDFNTNGQTDDGETLWELYNYFNPGIDANEEQAKQFIIYFDDGDVYWLEGYVNLLSALLEIGLAYDHQRLFNHSAHLFFAQPETPYSFLLDGPRYMDFSNEWVSDVITFVHLFNFNLIEPDRLFRAWQNLNKMTELSRQSWQAILAETDNQYEWLPNPQQTGVIPVAITEEMINQWMVFLEEADALLAGEKLIPFWRGDNFSQGLNLKAIFTEPTNFDLVLWIQGTGVASYLQKGEVTSPEVWEQLQRVFQGEFIGFALWFN